MIKKVSKPEKWAKATPDRSKIKSLMTRWSFSNTFYTFLEPQCIVVGVHQQFKSPTFGQGLFEVGVRYGIQDFNISIEDFKLSSFRNTDFIMVIDQLLVNLNILKQKAFPQQNTNH